MATIPSVENLSRVQAQPSQRVVSYGDVGAAARGMSQFGDTVTKLATHYGDQLADTQAQEAFNKLRQKELDLSAGEDGYTHKKGDAVVNTPKGGVAFLDDYKKRFADARAEIGATLTGKAREVFEQHAENSFLNFQKGLLVHSASEADAYHKQVYAGVLENAPQLAGAKWWDAQAVAGEVNRVGETIDKQAAREGIAPELAAGAKQKALGAVHESVVDGALAAGSIQYAEDYVNAHGDSMPPNALLRVRDKIHTLVKQQVSFAAAEAVMQREAQKIIPDELDRALAYIPARESNGKHWNPDGTIKVSPTSPTGGGGAYGKWQIRPTTAPHAAQVSGVEWNEELFYRKRTGDPVKDQEAERYQDAIGAGYFKYLLQKTGNLDEAYGAYNGGLANVRRWKKEAEEKNVIGDKLRVLDPSVKRLSWLDFAYKETRDYVVGARKHYEAGISARESDIIDLKNEVKNEVLARYPNATSDMVEAATTKMEGMRSDFIAAKKQREEQALLEVQQAVDAGQITSYQDLTPAQLSAMGEKRSSVRAYLSGKRSDQNDAAERSPVAIAFVDQMNAAPRLLAEKSVDEILALTPDIGSNNVSKLLATREKYRTDPTSLTKATIDADMFNTTVEQLGFGGSTEAQRAKRARVRAVVEQRIGVRKGEGVPITEELLRKVIIETALNEAGA